MENKKVIARIENLQNLRQKIVSMAPEKALNAILDSPQPAALIHSFPEEDFYFLIHEIGLEDSHPLLSLASDKQWEYIVDLEVWQKDRIELKSVTRWFDLLFKLDPDRFIKWFLDRQTQFMEFYLFKNIEVKIREHDQDPSEFDNEFFTYDDTFYLRFLDDTFQLETEESESDETINKDRNAFLSKFFKTLSAFDHITYQKVLLETCSVIPAETEEEAYRLRNLRLAEKGFLPYEEAIGIYQPLKAEDFENQDTKFISTDLDRKLFLPVPFYHSEMLEEENLFTAALKKIKIHDVIEQIQIEFAGLCNLIISADLKNIREKDELKSIVKKVSGYLNIGLERLSRDNTVPDAGHCSVLIRNYPLSSIFKVGYGIALDLKWRAEKWREKSWFENQGLLLGFWGEEWLGLLGGLLIKKPLFFDNYKTGVLYREFVSMEDIRATDNVLNEIMVFDDIFSLMAINPEPVIDRFLTYKNFILTLWARNHLGLSGQIEPLRLNEFQRLFDGLWADKKKPYKIRRSMKESFLSWLSEQTGLTDYEISGKLGHTLENLFSEIENEYGEVSSKDLDPRYINLFLIQKK
ncbi:MAG: hypothetical protein JRJ62_08430 [Deltaproteobacteria bacterium]|nr:hypothetical protein [Deltaproteobacteria bacterium]MBW2087394.1 hypothetical protein [Deltaproteobacteria bacterium]